MERLAGKPAVEQLKVVLFVDAAQMEWVVAQVALHKHYSLRIDQITIVSIAR